MLGPSTTSTSLQIDVIIIAVLSPPADVAALTGCRKQLRDQCECPRMAVFLLVSP